MLCCPKTESRDEIRDAVRFEFDGCVYICYQITAIVTVCCRDGGAGQRV